MILLDNLISIFAPAHCLGCGQDGAYLCQACQASFKPHPKLCIHCHRLSPDNKTCAKCTKAQPAAHVYVATLYEGPLKKAIKRYKYHRAQGVANVLANILEHALPSYSWDIIVPVPSSSSSHRQRGYNPAGVIAKILAAKLNMTYGEALGRVGQEKQTGANRGKRLKQLERAFIAKRIIDVRGMRLLLVDDIVTTGATISACASVLKVSGAKSVDAAAVARNIG